MSHQSLNTLIRKLDTITSLSDDDREAILRLPVKLADLRTDADIVREGDRPSQCCLLVEGFLCRYKNLSDGKRQIMAFYVSGDIPDLLSSHRSDGSQLGNDHSKQGCLHPPRRLGQAH